MYYIIIYTIIYLVHKIPTQGNRKQTRLYLYGLKVRLIPFTGHENPEKQT